MRRSFFDRNIRISMILGHSKVSFGEEPTLKIQIRLNMHKSANTLLLPRSFSSALYSLISKYIIDENDENDDNYDNKNKGDLHFLMVLLQFS